MDRVTQLDLQECLTAATSTGERELSEVHLRTFSHIAKKHGEAVNEAVARCWDWVSALQIVTPISKKAKQFEREVTTVYSRILLAWKMLMHMCKKSQWAMRFITDQPRLHLLCQGILHLASLQPIHRNAWEKPRARSLATTVYNDLTRIGSLITNAPLTAALEFLKRKGVSQLLQTRAITAITPIDLFYRFKFALKAKSVSATSIIEKSRDEFGLDKIRAFRFMSPFENTEMHNNQSITSSSTVSMATQANQVVTTGETEKTNETTHSNHDAPPGWLDDDEFDDIEFEDVIANDDSQENGDSTREEHEQSGKPPDSSDETDPLEKYRERNRESDYLSKQIVLIQKKLAEIQDRREWLPSQKTDYTNLMRHIDDLLELLDICTKVNTDTITSSALASSNSRILIEVSAK